MGPGLTRGALILALLVACNAGPSEEAITAAETAIEAARPVLEARAPADLASLERALADARAALEEGRYTDALRTAQNLPSRARDLVDAVTARARPPGPVEGPRDEPLPLPTESTPAPEPPPAASPTPVGS